MTSYIDVTIHLEVFDEKILFDAACAAMIKDGVPPDEAAQFADSPSECARYLLDPGVSPPGTNIEDSTAESFSG